MKVRTLIILALFTLPSFATTIDCTTKLTRGRTNDTTPQETWCGPIKMNIADNGVKYRRTTQYCNKVKVELFSIKHTDDDQFVSVCEKI
jgi:hypothetical protein